VEEDQFVPDYDEEPEVCAVDEKPPLDVGKITVVLGKQSGRRRRQKQKTTACGICKEDRRHLTRNHLPWYFEPQHACWSHKVNLGSLGETFGTSERDGELQIKWEIWGAGIDTLAKTYGKSSKCNCVKYERENTNRTSGNCQKTGMVSI